MSQEKECINIWEPLLRQTTIKIWSLPPHRKPATPNNFVVSAVVTRSPASQPDLTTTVFSLSVFAGPHLPEFLLPFRKPKRIRTAFSPSQLLKLEQAFEKNQVIKKHLSI